MRVAMVIWAWAPASRVTVPIGRGPSRNVTLPVGAGFPASLAVTVLVKVIVWPILEGFADEAGVEVVVPPGSGSVLSKGLTIGTGSGIWRAAP